MQEDRASWWFFLPILMLVMGVVPSAGLQNLLDASRVSAPSELRVSPGDLLLPATVSELAGAVESGTHKQQREIRFGPVVSEPGLVQGTVPARILRIAMARPGVLSSSPGSILYQFHTLSLQL